MPSYKLSARGDPTSLHERQIAESADEHNRFMDDEALDVVNRPIGSVNVSPQDQAFDYTAMRNDPNLAAQRVTQLIQRFGPTRGLLTFIDWAEKMEAQLNASNNVLHR